MDTRVVVSIGQGKNEHKKELLQKIKEIRSVEKIDCEAVDYGEGVFEILENGGFRDISDQFTYKKKTKAQLMLEKAKLRKNNNKKKKKKRKKR